MACFAETLTAAEHKRGIRYAYVSTWFGCFADVMLDSTALVIIYFTTDTVRHLATFVIIASACASPFNAFAHASYFTLRSGGRVIETLLFDSVYAWVAVIPTAFLLSRLTDWSFPAIFIAVVLVESLKCIMGFLLVKREHWARQLTTND